MRMRPNLVAAAVLSTVMFAAPAMSQMGPASVKSMGGVMTNQAGMTLYTFDKDEAGSGKSACNGPCAANWPPLAAGADAKAEGDYSIVTREDGSKQWAYKGKPLYLWAKDKNPGDKSGDGVNNVWHIVAQ